MSAQGALQLADHIPYMQLADHIQFVRNSCLKATQHDRQRNQNCVLKLLLRPQDSRNNRSLYRDPHAASQSSFETPDAFGTHLPLSHLYITGGGGYVQGFATVASLGQQNSSVP